MELSTAVSLIQKGILSEGTPQHWADLGAGSGLFTRALASLLTAGSTVTAVDRDESSLQSIVWHEKNVSLITRTADFTNTNLPTPLDGVLMANSLHYVKNTDRFLQSLALHLAASGRLLVVEYERNVPNPWVPYPVPFARLQRAGKEVGFQKIEQLAETPSKFGNGSIYAALLTLASSN